MSGEVLTRRLERIHRILIGLGSNDEPERHLKAGLEALSKIVRVRKVSPLQETEALGNPSTPPYLNGLVLAETPLDAASIKAQLKRIEEDHERSAVQRAQGLITLDLDLYFWDGKILDASFEKIPYLKKTVADWASELTPPDATR